MEKKKFMTQAIGSVKGLSHCLEDLTQSMVLNGRSDTTIDRYTHKISQICFHYNKLPEQFSEQEVNNYLEMKIRDARGYSKSEFKHMVFSLRYYYRLRGLEERYIKLPKIKKEKRLPVVLSQDECIELFHCIRNMKHKLMIMLMYSAGLRVRELLNLKISDVDTHRLKIHIRRGKGVKDRYVPLSVYILKPLVDYIITFRPVEFIFNGSQRGKSMSTSAARNFLRGVVKRTGIRKKGVCMHTLRHSFATHLLESGLDIVSIKELLGHECIDTTMIYLHVADCGRKKSYSPLDILYKQDLAETETSKTIMQLTAYAERAQHMEIKHENQLSLFENES